MKKVFLLLAFFGVLAIVDVNAQACAKKTASCAATCAQKAAAKMASMDANIETRLSATTGEKTYVKKSVCAQSGNVSFTPVEYCTKAGKFVNVSPSKAASCTKSATTAKSVNVAKKATSCTAAQKAACQKTCTAAEKAACQAKKASTSATKTATATMVKMENKE